MGLTLGFNFRISSIRESGIYEHLFKVSLNPRRIGPDQGEKVVVRTFDFEKTSLAQLRGILILFASCELVTIVFFLLEFFMTKHFSTLVMYLIFTYYC